MLKCTVWVDENQTVANDRVNDEVQPIRVLLANDHLGFHGSMHGVGRFFLNIIPKFDPLRVQVLPVILRPRDELATPFDDCGIRIRFLERHRFDPRTLLDFLRLIRDEKIDVLHVQGYNADVLGRVAGLVKGIPVILHQRDANAVPPPYIRAIDRVLSHAVTRPLAVSEDARNFLAKRRGIPVERTQVLPNGVDIVSFSPAGVDERAAARAAFGLASGAPCAGVLARLHEIKGIIHLIRAIPDIVRSHPGFHLLLAGNGQEKCVLENEAKQLGVAEYVSFIGFQADVRRFLAALDLLVIPSLSEGCPNALLEGMAMGLCVVATNVGGMAEILEDGQTALLVPPGDPNALSTACSYAISETELRHEIASRALLKVREFSLDETVNTLTELYHELCAAGDSKK